jgi:hypothetical protein
MKREGHNGIPSMARDESVAVIEEEIRRNRAEMDQTLEELSRRLEPRRIADNLWDTVRDHIPTGSDAAHKAQDIGANIGRRIGAHPIPSAIVGAGLLWLLAEEASGERTHMRDITHGLKEGARAAGKSMRRMGEAAVDQVRQARMRSTESHSEYGGRYAGGTHFESSGSIGGMASRAEERLSQAGERVGERVKDTAWRARERLAHTGERVADAASHTGERVRTSAVRAGDTVSRVYEDHPIAVAMAAIGAGLLAGIAVPNTRRENEAMGAAAQRMRRQAVRAAEGAAGQVMEAAEEKVDEIGHKAEQKLEGGGEKKGQTANEPWGSTAQPHNPPPKTPPAPPTAL